MIELYERLMREQGFKLLNFHEHHSRNVFVSHVYNISMRLLLNNRADIDPNVASYISYSCFSTLM